jgi:hypothetical protein
MLKMSKVGPDADWSLCWEMYKGFTEQRLQDMKISEIKADDYTPIEEEGDVPHDFGDIYSHINFGDLLINQKVWVAKTGEENYLEIDGKIVWEKQGPKETKG